MNCGLISSDSEEWREALEHVTWDFYHLPGYVEMVAERGGGRAEAFFATDGRDWFLIPLIWNSLDEFGASGWNDVSTPYGYPGPVASLEVDAAFLSACIGEFTSLLKRENVLTAFLRMHPIWNRRNIHAWNDAASRIVMHGETVAIDLEESVEAMWKETRESHRRGINKLVRHGFAADIDEGWDRIGDFYSSYCETMERVSADRSYFFDLEYFAKLRRILGSRIHLVIVTCDGEFACGGLFTTCNGVVQYHLGGTSEQYFEASPSKLLFDYVRRWAKDRGEQYLHLGGGVGGTDDSLFRFKSGFSKLRLPFYTCRIVSDANRYEELVKSWIEKTGLVRDGIDGFFPEYRRPDIE